MKGSGVVSRASQRDRIRTAYHEAGHAVIAYVRGFTPYRVTIKPGINEDGPYLGEIRIKSRECDYMFAPRLADYMLYELAGMAAENRYSRRRADDFEKISGQSDMVSFDKHWSELCTLTDNQCPDDEDFKIEVIRAVRHYWSAIQTIARLLLERETIEHRELAEALSSAVLDHRYIQLLWDYRTWIEAGLSDRVVPFSRYAELETAAAQFAAILNGNEAQAA